ncbi:EamA family transporter [Rhodobacterales bacterium LSUCC0387]|nr:EamA family transporter [Rhodobacterales bacterium LSUCC0374]MBF9040854.1 EamA family transporter [Rhodobacterales bacterium LSUCC0387]
MIGFCITAPIMDGMAKLTPNEVPVLQIVAARFGVQVVILIPLAIMMGVAMRPTARDVVGHLMRGLMLLLATFCFFSAIRYMPIANAMAIFFVEPFILTLMGGLLLGEQVGPRRIIACVIGFIGALFVIQPSFQELGFVALLPLGTAVTFAAYMILTRTMSDRQHPIALQAYTALGASLLILPLIVGFEGTNNPWLDPVWPNQFAMMALLAVGILATISHLLLSVALKLAPTATIAPLQYLEIAGSVAVGYVLFQDFPDSLTWLGIAIIVGSGLYVFARERRADLQRRPTPPV